MRPPYRRHWDRSSSTRRTSNDCAGPPRESFWPAWSMPDTGSVFTRNWLHFGRILRGLGFDAGPARMLPFLKALTVIDMGRFDAVRTVVHAHFARRREELALLDQALLAFLDASREERALFPRAPAPPREQLETIPLTGRQLKVLDEADAPEDAEAQEVASYSQAELLRHKDFDSL